MSTELILRWPSNETKPEELFRQLRPARVVTEAANGIAEGLWPGVSRGESKQRRGNDETASASREPWVDANGYLVHYYRALRGQAPLLTYAPPQSEDKVIPFETVELALVEARVNGGNFALAFDRRYRDALRQRDQKALEAWKSLVQTARWLESNDPLFGARPLPIITALVEEGPTREIANLLFRRGASPWLVATPPAPSPAIAALVAVSLKQVPASVFDHARAGSTVILDSKPEPSWTMARQDDDRTVYSLGKGQVMVYKKRIADPSEFALDVIDVVTHKRRAARLWNALAAIPLATEAPGGALLHVVNYGSPVEAEVQARIQGLFSKADLLRPGHAAEPVKTARRGTATEIYLPRLDRVATVRFIR